MPEDEESTTEGTAKGGKSKFMTIGIVAALMLVEGGAVYWGVNAFSEPPAEAKAEELKALEEESLNTDADVEIPLPEINAFNKREGRLYLYAVDVSIMVRKEDADKVTKAIEAREATIKDRFNNVIRSAEPKHLNEPGLDTIRRQFVFELGRVLGDDQLILDLLIPKFFQSPAGL